MPGLGAQLDVKHAPRAAEVPVRVRARERLAAGLRNPLGPLQETAPAVIMRPIEGGF
jgi:hypothetical protein